MPNKCVDDCLAPAELTQRVGWTPGSPRRTCQEAAHSVRQLLVQLAAVVHNHDCVGRLPGLLSRRQQLRRQRSDGEALA
jgi:hypothetical protein